MDQVSGFSFFLHAHSGLSEQFVSPQVSVNQRELVGILKAVSAQTVVGKKSCDKVAVALAKFISRSGLAQEFVEETKAVKPIFDPIMVRHWTDLKKSGVTITTYMDCNKDLMSMLLNEADYEAVRQCGGDYISVKGHLGRLIQSSAYGKALFGFTEAAIEAQDFSSKVDKALEELRPCLASSDKVDEFRRNMEEEAAAYAAMKLPMTRNIKATRCQTIRCEETSLIDACASYCFAFCAKSAEKCPGRESTDNVYMFMFCLCCVSYMSLGLHCPSRLPGPLLHLHPEDAGR